MLSRIAAIALNTYREAVRARILLGLAALALATAAYSIAIGEFSLRAASRVVADLGAASISLYAILVAVVLGATSLYRELEQKTLFPILSRPIRRAEFLVGKFAGMLLTLGVFIALDASAVLFILARHGGRSLGTIVTIALAVVMAAGLSSWRSTKWRTFGIIGWSGLAFVLAAWLASGAPDDRRVVLGASALAFCEVTIVSAIATLFSAFSTPFLTSVFTVGVFLVGREADTLSRLPTRVFGDALAAMGRVLSRVVPNLQVYVPPRPLLTGEAQGSSLGSYLVLALVQAIAWSTGLLVIANWIFKRRDLS